jgi:hypothetical protein
MLRPGGLLVITSPDTDSMFRKLMRCRWPMLQPFQHTAMFSGAAVGRFLEEAGLHMLEIRSAEKVMTASYLLGQLDIYFPHTTRFLRRAGGAFPKLMNRSIPFHIGEFIALARKWKRA